MSLSICIDESHLSSLMTAIASVDDWFSLGIILGVKYRTLEMIKEDHSTTNQCKLNMLIAWLRSSEETCTKQQLSIVLRCTCLSFLLTDFLLFQRFDLSSLPDEGALGN